MLSKKFNKLGGTEIRVKNQVDFYLTLCEWIKKVQEKHKILSILEWDKKYKEWTKQEGIYSYDNDQKIKIRFGFIINSLKKIGIYYQEQKFKIPKKFDKNSIFKNLMSYKNNNVYPFKAMIDFVMNNQSKNNAKKIILSFLVYDGKETFADLYERDIIEDLAKKKSSKTTKLHFQKPPKVKIYIDKILEKKKENLEINIDDMKGYNHSSDNYLKQIVFKKRKKFNLTRMIDGLNQIDLKIFWYELNYNKISQLLEKEYLDLFSRWLYNFGLIDVTGTKATIFYNHKIKKDTNNYYIEEEKINCYPWKFEEVVTYISKIAKDDFSFKDQNKDLRYVPNSVLAEYFVNLFYSYKLAIKPQNFCQFVNTKVNDKLHPIFTAPGYKADMSYSDTTRLINIETTIHKTKTQIENHEIFPCTKHYEEVAKKSNANFKYLIFISPVHPNQIKENFNLVFKSKNPYSNLVLCKFDNLKIPF